MKKKMQEFPFILAECQEINDLLYIPLATTQRIKYTCFSVSKNYIILGSTSGSLYLFSRESCAFRQLIPLSEGAVFRVQISPDEKSIALSTIRGAVCLLTIKPCIKLVTVSTEHIGNKVTSLCWNDNNIELYAGDNIGKISVSVLSSFTVNGMFQSSCCSLMNLDSSIIQMNFYSTLLLISSLNRSYICDTVQEQYKQIGNKPRDGDFGACFLKSNTLDKDGILHLKRSDDFEGESLFGEEINEEGLPKIYCARPGSRIWEVDINGTVVKTHQFKDALGVPPCYILRQGKFDYPEREENIWSSQSINFKQLFVIDDKYLFTYTSNGLYILDPQNAGVLLWNDELKNINAVSIFENKIYMMTLNGIFHCLTFTSVNVLVSKVNNQKMHKQCIELCGRLSTCNIDVPLISDLISRIESKNQDGISSLEISTLMNENKTNNSVKVNECDFSFPNLDEETCNNVENTNSKDLQTRDFLLETHSTLKSLQLMCELGMKNLTDEEIISNTMKSAKDMLEELQNRNLQSVELKSYLIEAASQAEIHYKNSLFEHLSIQVISTIKNQNLLQELASIFVSINSMLPKLLICTCDFPYPNFTGNKRILPKYFENGVALIGNLDRQNFEDLCLNICYQVPYMWKEYLSLKSERNDFSKSLLQLCVQSKDAVALSIILPELSDSQWGFVCKILKDIDNKFCLMCGKKLNVDRIKDTEFLLDWNTIVANIIKKLGANETFNFLSKVCKKLPDVHLNYRIFEEIIFSKILHHNGVKHSVELNSSKAGHNSICSKQISRQLMNSITKDIDQPLNVNLFGCGPHHWGMRYSLKKLTCPCCTLSLETPVLLGTSGISLFSCGHAYHVNCMLQKKISRCYLHCQ